MKETCETCGFPKVTKRDYTIDRLKPTRELLTQVMKKLSRLEETMYKNAELKRRNDWLEETLALCQDRWNINLDEDGFPEWKD
jgi:hypothetical protein